jgi:O-antigen ligase
MGIIAVAISYSVYFVYKVIGRKATIVYLVISGIAGAILFSLIIVGIGTDSFVPNGGFSGRIVLWRASVVSFFHHPILGIGIHNVGETIAAYTGASALAPQNSYLRIFVGGGLISGGLYLWLIVSSALGYVKVIKTNADLVTICLFIAFLLIQFTDTAHPFGVNKNAVIFGITLGYVIEGVYVRKEN